MSKRVQIRFSVGHNTPENHELAEMLATIDGASYVDILGNGEIWLQVNGKLVKLVRFDSDQSELHLLRYINRKLHEQVQELKTVVK